MTIDCGTCSRHHTPTCDDCVVTFIVDREPDEAVVIDVAEFSALKRLQSAGLVPDLLHDGPPLRPSPDPAVGGDQVREQHG